MQIHNSTTTIAKDIIDKVIPRGTAVTASNVGLKKIVGAFPTNQIELEIENIGADVRLMWMPGDGTLISTLAATPISTVVAGEEYLMTVTNPEAYFPGQTVEIRASDTTTLLFIGVVQGGKKLPYNNANSATPNTIRLFAPFGAMTIASVTSGSIVYWALARNDTSNHYYVGVKMLDGEIRRFSPPLWAKYISFLSTEFMTETRLFIHETG